MRLITLAAAAAAFMAFGSPASAALLASSATPITLTQPNNSNSNVFGLLSPHTGDVYVGFDLAFSGTVSNNDFAALWFDTASTGDHTNRPNIGLKANGGTGGADYFVRTTGTGGNFDSAPVLQAGNGTSVSFFGHLYKSVGSASYNRFDLWLNPTLTGTALLASTADARATDNSGLSAITAFGFRTANLSGNDTVTISNLRISDNALLDIAPATSPAGNAVPEPASLALTALALLGMAGARRRRG